VRLKEAMAMLVEAGALTARRPAETGIVDPHQLVGEVVERMRGQALARDVALVTRLEGRTGSVRADRTAVAQVLTNFVQNALRVAPAGSEIAVGARDDDGWTRFGVADRGPGVPEAELASIFEHFTQGHARAREAGQVGLGLAIARRIVEEHHGRIWAENRADGGARFCFALPSVVG
jgi:signal transduction histidine kinase